MYSQEQLQKLKMPMPRAFFPWNWQAKKSLLPAARKCADASATLRVTFQAEAVG